jgi:hypothetical protein
MWTPLRFIHNRGFQWSGGLVAVGSLLGLEWGYWWVNWQTCLQQFEEKPIWQCQQINERILMANLSIKSGKLDIAKVNMSTCKEGGNLIN